MNTILLKFRHYGENSMPLLYITTLLFNYVQFQLRFSIRSPFYSTIIHQRICCSPEPDQVETSGTSKGPEQKFVIIEAGV